MRRVSLLLLLLFSSLVSGSGVLTSTLGIVEDATVTLSGENTAFNDTSAPWAAYAFIKVDGDGNVYEYGGTSATPSYVQVDTTDDWIRPTSVAGDTYEVRATLNSGSLDTGTTGTWLPLNADHAWSVFENVQFGSADANLTLEIQHVVLGVLDSNTYVLQATCDL